MKYVQNFDGTLAPEYYNVKAIYEETTAAALRRMERNKEENLKLNQEREARVLELKRMRPDLYALRASYIQREDQ